MTNFKDCEMCGVNYNADTFNKDNPHTCIPVYVKSHSQNIRAENKRLRDALEVISKLDWSDFFDMLAAIQYMQRTARESLRTVPTGKAENK